MNFKDGTIYIGTFMSDKYNGQGKLTQNGETYVGNFKNNVKDGKGLITFADSSKYEG